MDALIRATSSSFKSFLTRRSDRYRPPYGRHTIDRQRQCVFAGTINPPVGGYLKHSTGSRRIWPVLCRGMIDLEALARDRDQLWAEAVVRYKKGDKWWLETLELEALAAVEQTARYKTDPWQEPIEEWLGNRDDVRVAEVLEQLFGQAPLEQSQSAQNRVAHILTHLGFGKHRPRTDNGGRENRYSREKSPK
jgi:predicted P-loop ATPase